MVPSLVFAVERISLILQIAAACGLAGIAWYRHFAVYMTVHRVGRRLFPRALAGARTVDAIVAGPLLAVDMLAACVYLFVVPVTVAPVVPLAGAAAVFGAAALALFPKRRVLRALATEFSAAQYRRLLCFHWQFALLCSIRAILVVLLLLNVMGV